MVDNAGSRNRGLFAVVIAVLLPLAGGEVQARKPTLERARQLVEKELRYEEGISLVRRLLRRGNLGDAQRVEAFWLLGIAYVARGNTDSAEAAFWELLRIAPKHRLDPMVSPKVQEVFERVRGKLVTAPKLIALNARRTVTGLRFDARFEDEQGRLARLQLFYELAESDYDSVPMAVGEGEASATVDLSSREVLDSPSWRVEFYVVGYAADDESVARLGSAEAPSVVILDRVTERVVVPKVEPWYGRWWLWAAVGAAVIAATTTAVVLTSDSSCQGPDGTLSPICL